MTIKRLLALAVVLLTGFLSIEYPLPIAAATVTSENDPNTAEVVFNSATPQISGFKVVESGSSTVPTLTTRSGENCWLMDKLKNTENSTINFTLSDELKPTSFDGSVYDIEVDYYDSGKGYCFLFYNNIEGDRQYKDTIYTQNTCVWKTQKITLTDADFIEKANGKYDFYLSIRAKGSQIPISNESIAIKRVKVTRRPNQNKLYITAKIDETGNSFKWFSKDKVINTTVHNYSGENANASITYRAITDSGFIKGEITKNVDIQKDSDKDISLNFGSVDYCDIYKLEAEIKLNDGSEFTQLVTKFAILKTDPDGIKDSTVWFASHIDQYREELMKKGVDVMALSNAAGMREDMVLSRVDTIADILLPYLAQNNMQFMPIFMRNYPESKIDPLDAGMPYTANGLEGWRKVVSDITNKVKDYVERYEIWNEPNIKSFNPLFELCKGEVYANVCKVAREEVERIDPGAKLGGPGIAHTGLWIDKVADGYPGKEYFDDAMKYGMWKYLDAVSLHPYAQKAPEKANLVLDQEYYSSEFRKYKPDAEVWNTEMGCTSADKATGSDRLKGRYICRSILIFTSCGAGDVNAIYNLEGKGIVKIDREDMFGHISPLMEDCKEWGTICFPRESYLMITGHAYVMAQSTPDKIVDVDDENVNVYTYNSNKFNKKIAVMYCNDDVNRVSSFDLGVDKVDVYDTKGNKSEIYGENGIFTFELDGDPIYVVGDFKDVKTSEIKTIETGEKNIDASTADSFSIELKKNTTKELSIDVELPEYAKAIKIEKFDRDSAKIIIQNNADADTNYMVNVSVKDGMKTIFQTGYTITSKVPVVISPNLQISMNGDNYNVWNAKLKITNLANSTALRGHIEFKNGELTKRFKNIDIGLIPPMTTGEINFGFGNIYKKGQHTIEYDLITENGNRYPGASTFDITLARYANVKPVIDGTLDRKEWYYDTAMYAETQDRVKAIPDWSGKSDISGKCMVMWDEENMYFAADVTDNYFNAAESGGNQYKGDDIQIGVFYGDGGHVAIGQANTSFHEIGLALTENGAEAYRWRAQDDAIPVGLINNVDLRVINKGEKTYYEAKIPWETLLKPNQQPKEGDEILFTFLFNDNDGSGRRGWIEYTGGIGESKDSTLFAKMKLIK